MSESSKEKLIVVVAEDTGWACGHILRCLREVPLSVQCRVVWHSDIQCVFYQAWVLKEVLDIARYIVLPDLVILYRPEEFKEVSVAPFGSGIRNILDKIRSRLDCPVIIIPKTAQEKLASRGVRAEEGKVVILGAPFAFAELAGILDNLLLSDSET